MGFPPPFDSVAKIASTAWRRCGSPFYPTREDCISVGFVVKLEYPNSSFTTIYRRVIDHVRDVIGHKNRKSRVCSPLALEELWLSWLPLARSGYSKSRKYYKKRKMLQKRKESSLKLLS